MKGSDDRNSAPRPFASDAARRIEAIIEGAERAAERVIDEAEQQARAYLAEAEAEADRAVAERLASLGELTEELVAQADAIRRQSELLTRSLQEAKARLEAGGRPAAEPDAASPPRLAAVESPPDPAAESPPDPAAGAGGREAPAEAGGPAGSASGRDDGGGRGTRAEPRGRGTPAGARLLATQMAVSGSSREEIATRLRNGFEIEDTDAILDAILGPEG